METPDRYFTFHAETFSSGTKGRAFSRIRNNVFVVDDPSRPGYDGPGEEPGAGELFMAAITTCAGLMMERLARADGLPLERVHVGMDGSLDTQADFGSNPPVLDSARMLFTFTGLSGEQAEQLVETFKRR